MLGNRTRVQWFHVEINQTRRRSAATQVDQLANFGETRTSVDRGCGQHRGKLHVKNDAPVETASQPPSRYEGEDTVQCTQQCVENMRETGWSPIYCRR
jgi:hypothetical protein